MAFILPASELLKIGVCVIAKTILFTPEAKPILRAARSSKK
jgi:hypothetical protein